MRFIRWAAIAAVAVGSVARLGNTAIMWRRSWASACRPCCREGVESGRGSPAAGPSRPRQSGRADSVVATVVAPKSMPIIVEAVGTVQAIASIQLKSRIDSQLLKVNVEEGALVKEGDLLFQLDSRTLRAQLAQIEAQIRKDQAQVEQAKRDSARRQSAHQGSRDGGDARHQRHQPEGPGGAARVRRGDAPEHLDPDQLHRDPRAGVGPHRLDPQQGRHDTAHRRQHRDRRARDHQRGRSIFVSFAIPQVFLPPLARGHGQGAGHGECGDRRAATSSPAPSPSSRTPSIR